MDTQGPAPDSEHRRPHLHVVPVQVLLGVFTALIALTILTVALTHFPSGQFEIWIALSIASVKAVLVCAYFMHLRYDKPLHTLFMLSSIAFLTLFLILTMSDAIAYHAP